MLTWIKERRRRKTKPRKASCNMALPTSDELTRMQCLTMAAAQLAEPCPHDKLIGVAQDYFDFIKGTLATHP